MIGRRLLSGVGSAAVALGVLACEGTAPEYASEFPIPAAYVQWWEETQQCSGLSGRLESLRFYKVPGNSFECPTGQCSGRWEADGKIYLAERYAMHEMVVRHEMLHALLGKGGHPDPPFAKGCGLTWSSWRSGMAADQGVHIE